MKTRTITIHISEKVYQSLKDETLTTALCHGLWNATAVFLGKFLEKLDAGEAEWDCSYASEKEAN